MTTPGTVQQLQAHYNDLLEMQDQTDHVPLTKALDAVGLALSLLGHAQTPALTDALKEVARLRVGLESIVNCRNPLTRAAVREACAEILAATPTDTSTDRGGAYLADGTKIKPRALHPFYDQPEDAAPSVTSAPDR